MHRRQRAAVAVHAAVAEGATGGGVGLQVAEVVVQALVVGLALLVGRAELQRVAAGSPVEGRAVGLEPVAGFAVVLVDVAPAALEAAVVHAPVVGVGSGPGLPVVHLAAARAFQVAVAERVVERPRGAFQVGTQAEHGAALLYVEPGVPGVHDEVAVVGGRMDQVRAQRQPFAVAPVQIEGGGGVFAGLGLAVGIGRAGVACAVTAQRDVRTRAGERADHADAGGGAAFQAHPELVLVVAGLVSERGRLVPGGFLAAWNDDLVPGRARHAQPDLAVECVAGLARLCIDHAAGEVAEAGGHVAVIDGHAFQHVGVDGDALRLAGYVVDVVDVGDGGEGVGRVDVIVDADAVEQERVLVERRAVDADVGRADFAAVARAARGFAGLHRRVDAQQGGEVAVALVGVLDVGLVQHGTFRIGEGALRADAQRCQRYRAVAGRCLFQRVAAVGQGDQAQAGARQQAFQPFTVADRATQRGRLQARGQRRLVGQGDAALAGEGGQRAAERTGRQLGVRPGPGSGCGNEG